MCEFHDSNSNGFGDIWWTDKLIYFSSVESGATDCVHASSVKPVKKRIYKYLVRAVYTQYTAAPR